MLLLCHHGPVFDSSSTIQKYTYWKDEGEQLVDVHVGSFFRMYCLDMRVSFHSNADEVGKLIINTYTYDHIEKFDLAISS